jgi:hypothetical protein
VNRDEGEQEDEVAHNPSYPGAHPAVQKTKNENKGNGESSAKPGIANRQFQDRVDRERAALVGAIGVVLERGHDPESGPERERNQVQPPEILATE